MKPRNLGSWRSGGDNAFASETALRYPPIDREVGGVRKGGAEVTWRCTCHQRGVWVEDATSSSFAGSASRDGGVGPKDL